MSSFLIYYIIAGAPALVVIVLIADYFAPYARVRFVSGYKRAVIAFCALKISSVLKDEKKALPSWLELNLY